MHVVSMTSTIVAPSDQAVTREGGAVLTKLDQHAHPPGTVLDMPDEEAKRLIARGLVELYDRAVHGADPQRKAASLARVSVTPEALPADEPRPLYRLQSVPRWDA
jgi:hypothetical protein